MESMLGSKESRKRRCPMKDKHGKEREDRISKLPDDIICSIISLLSTIDAVRTSVLSRRWRHVYTFTTYVGFIWSKMLGNSCCHYDSKPKKLRRLQRKFVQVVDTFLQHHSGSKIMSFELVCPFQGRIAHSFRKWMNSIGSLGAENLILEYCCPYHVLDHRNRPLVFSCDFLGEASSLKRLCLKGVSFQTQSRNVLKDVELNDVDLTAEAVECILSNCSTLQSLKLKYCGLPSKLRIRGPHLQLKRLTVSRCSKVAEIDLSAINLITFEFCSIMMVKIFFSDAPLVQNLFVEICGHEATPRVFEKVFEVLPHLKCMYFKYTASFSERFEIGEVNNLSNLRQLALFLNYYNKLDMLELAAVLDACPLLHKFHLSMKESSASSRNQAENRVARRHMQLKEFELSGFNETQNECDFILYILKNVISLERLSIFAHFRSYDVDLGCWLPAENNPRYDEKKQRIILTWLGEHAISKNVEITVV